MTRTSATSVLASRVLIALLASVVVLALLGAPAPRAAAQPCAPLTTGAVVAQLIGAPLRSPVVDDTATTLAGRHAGTVVLLGDAITSAGQVRDLVDALDRAAPPGVAPLIAVDEEGGRVARFGRAGVTTRLPSAREQARTASPEEVRAMAVDLGGQMAALGVDWDLAPVLDMTDADAGTVIGDRSYGADPVTAGAYGSAFAAGLQQAGVRTAGKHFPDHGLTAVDTHRSPVTVDVTLAQLRDHHLVPYRTALPHLDAIMLSHLRVPSLDPDLPVSLSGAAIGWLRSELANPEHGGRYDGVVVTDDLSMQAVAAVAGQPDAALSAVRGGADVVLVGDPAAAAAVHERLVAALGDGTLDRERVREAARRVLRLKGLAPVEVSCRLGLQPVGEATAVRDGTGQSFLVEDGVRRLLPDLETIRSRRVQPARYDDAEVATLPVGPAVPTVRRLQPTVVALPGSDPADLAVVRSVQAHGARGASHVVLVPTAPAWAAAMAAQAVVAPDTRVGPDSGAADGGAGDGGAADGEGAGSQASGDVDRPLHGVTPTTAGNAVGTVLPVEHPARVAGDVSALARSDATLVVLGAIPLDDPRVVARVALDDPVEASLATSALRDRAPAPPEVLVVAHPDAAGLVVLAPLIAAGRIGVLLDPGPLDPRIREQAAAHAGPVHTLGLPPEATVGLDATRLPEPHWGLAGWARDTFDLDGSLLVHDGAGALLATLPLGATSGSPALHQLGRPDRALVDAVAGWFLPASATRPALLVGTPPDGWGSVGLPTYYRR